MRIAGVDVTVGGAALLAVLVQRRGNVPLGVRIGEAVDTLQPDLSLSSAERESVLLALDGEDRADLARLRSVLLQEREGNVDYASDDWWGVNT